MTVPDPALQDIIEQDFRPVTLTTGPPDNSVALCEKHSLEKCTDCDIDFISLNRLAKLLVNNPNLLCPPPANVISQKLTQAVNNTKEEGNVRSRLLNFTNTQFTSYRSQQIFKKGLHGPAISRYTMAANIAVQRPPWEAQQLMREELSTVVSNRSAAHFESGDFIGALVDADTVIALRRNWSKGHFRKAKALLGLGKLEEAKESIKLGLSYEPMNSVSRVQVLRICVLLMLVATRS
jgi:translocation protein SEC72